MSVADPQPAAPEAKLRWYQYSLRTIFVLTTITAVFFSVACSLGYVDAIVALAVFLVVVGITQYPRRAHLTTHVVVTIIAGTLLWLNLRPTGWQKICNEMPPDQLDAVTKSMFYRGWPVGPWMICFHQNLIIRRGGEGAIIFDGLFYVIVLFAVKAACEQYFQRRSWLAWVAYGILLLGMFMLAVAIDLRINSVMRTPYGPSVMPAYIIFTGVGVFMIGLAFKTITDRRNQKGQRAANPGQPQGPPSPDQPGG